jgi:3-oxoacyl-[acyl-carrier protein] reductase
MTDRFLGGVARSGLPAEEYVRRAAVDVPLQRIGTPEEFASVAVFLASERASYVTGTALQIDGGLVRANV